MRRHKKYHEKNRAMTEEAVIAFLHGKVNETTWRYEIDQKGKIIVCQRTKVAKGLRKG